MKFNASTITLCLGILLLGTTSPLQAARPAGPLFASFAQDTLMSCINMFQHLEPVVTGGAAPYQYLWTTGETTHAIDVPVVQEDTAVYAVMVTDGDGNSVVATVVVISYGDCVWPGDANGDATANVLDLLSIGVAYNNLGPMRPFAHHNWVGQPAPAWSQALPTGVNHVHADANGDGVVNTSDLTPLMLNYVAPNQATYAPYGSPGVSPMLAVPMPTFLPPNQTIVLPVVLGTVQVPIDSVYGIAFSITYDPQAVVPGSVSVAFRNSWLGTPNADLAGIYKVFEASGQIDVGISRIDHTFRYGAGELADIVVTIDDVIGKRDSSLFFFVIDRVHVIRTDGSYIPVDAKPSIAWVTDRLNATDLTQAQALRVVQQGNILQLSHSGNARIYTASLTDLTGRTIATLSGQGAARVDFPVSVLSSGMYLLSVITDAGTFRRAVQLMP